MPHPPAQVRPALEQQPERLEAARRRSSTDRCGRPAGSSSRAERRPARAPARAPRRSRASAVELVRVDRDRMRRHERVARVEARARARRRGTRSRQRSVWKPTTSLASSPSWIARDDRSRQHRPGLAVHPWDVREVGQRRLGQLLAHERAARGRGGSRGRRRSRPARARAPRAPRRRSVRLTAT